MGKTDTSQNDRAAISTPVSASSPASLPKQQVNECGAAVAHEGADRCREKRHADRADDLHPGGDQTQAAPARRIAVDGLAFLEGDDLVIGYEVMLLFDAIRPNGCEHRDAP